MKKALYSLLVVIVSQSAHAAVDPTADLNTSKSFGGFNKGIELTGAPKIPLHSIMGDSVHCFIDQAEENRVQKCEAATQNAIERAKQLATDAAITKANDEAVEEMSKSLRPTCERHVENYKTECVNQQLAGISSDLNVNSCTEILPHVDEARTSNTDMLNRCGDLADLVHEWCTKKAVGFVPANSIRESSYSEDSLAKGTSSNPEDITREIAPETPMVEAYENTIANYNILKDKITGQIASLDQARTEIVACEKEQVAVSVESQTVEYTDDRVESGVESSVQDVRLARFSQKAAEADAAGLYLESKNRTTADGRPIQSDLIPGMETYSGAVTSDYGTTVRVVPTSSGAGDVTSMLDGITSVEGNRERRMVEVPMPRLRPAINDKPAESTAGKNAGTGGKNQPSATTSSNNTSPTTTSNNNTDPTQQYLNNSNAYGGGTAAGSGFNPSQLLSMGGQANVNEKLGQYNGVDYSGNSFYGNTNGRYNANTVGNYSGSKASERRGVGSSKADGFVRNANSANNGSGSALGYNGFSNTGSAGGRTGGYGVAQRLPEQNAGVVSQDKKAKNTKNVRTKTGNKQVYSNRSEGGAKGQPAPATRILSSQNSRVPASHVVEKFKQAQKRGEKFDPSKYEPTTLAERKAYERVTGRHLAGRKSNGMPWPNDIRQCKRPDSCKDVFGHVSDQFRLQFLVNGI